MLTCRAFLASRSSRALTSQVSLSGDDRMERSHDRTRRRITFYRESFVSHSRRLRALLEGIAVQSVSTIEGGCLCGAVRYRASGQAHGITHCHCRTCRRASGAPMVTWAGFDSDKFNFTQGQPVSYASSQNVVRTFCGRCGTALTYRRLDLPESVDLTLGSMDDPEKITPEDHTWTENRISWVTLDHLPAYPQERKTE